MVGEGSVVKFTSAKELTQIENPSDFKKDDIKVFKEFHLPKFYAFNLLFSIFTFLLELYLECKLAYIYYKSNEHVYFALTLVFIVAPALVTTAFSMRWYIQDEDDVNCNKRPRLWRWAIRLLMLALQMAPIMRYIDVLSYGIRSSIARKQGNNLKYQDYLRLMIDEDSTASLLRLFTCFLQSCPQAILQCVFLLTQIRSSTSSTINTATTVSYNYLGYQTYSVLVSVIVIAWSLTCYHRTVRAARDDKDKFTVSAAVMVYFWYLFYTLSRMVALSLLATIYPSWFLGLCLAHWGIMSLWLSIGHQQTAVCASRCEELILSSALGLAYIFTFISPKDGPTRYTYLAYYLVCFIENTTALVAWCITGGVNMYVQYGPVGAQIISFILGIFFMVSYYKFCHPSGTPIVISKSVNLQKSASL